MFMNIYKSTDNGCEQWDIRETNDWIIIFDNKSWFLFSQPIPKHLVGLV